MPGGDASSLAGIEVAITGRLAAMPRDEAVERLAASGGRYVEQPTAATDLLVVGEAGPPLGEDGRLTAKLRRARELQNSGASIAVVPEAELLDRLGLGEHRTGLRRLYTTSQLSRILGVPPSRIRSWVRHGLIEPVESVRRLEYFDFAQVTSARKLLQLTAGGVTPARLRKSLEQLERWSLTAEPSLAQLERLGAGGTLLVRLDDGRLVEPDGQLQLDWEEAPQAPSRDAPASPPDRDAWFDRGIGMEEAGRLEEAADAYRTALESGDPRPEIHFNLGNVLYAEGEPAAAADHFFQASELDADYVEAWNNLGNALADLERTDDAIAAYRRALDIEPRYADAHYNLAQVLIRIGSPRTARRHLVAYLAEDPASTWAQEVRTMLAAIDG